MEKRGPKRTSTEEKKKRLQQITRELQFNQEGRLQQAQLE